MLHQVVAWSYSDVKGHLNQLHLWDFSSMFELIRTAKKLFCHLKECLMPTHTARASRFIALFSV